MRRIGKVAGMATVVVLAGAGQAAPPVVAAVKLAPATLKARFAGSTVFIGQAKLPVKIAIGQLDQDQPQITSAILNPDTRVLTVRVRNAGTEPTHQALLQASISRTTRIEVPSECHSQPGPWGSAGYACTPAHPELGNESALDVFRLIAPVAPKQTKVVPLPLSEFAGKFLNCADPKPGTMDTVNCQASAITGGWILTVTLYNQGGK